MKAWQSSSITLPKAYIFCLFYIVYNNTIYVITYGLIREIEKIEKKYCIYVYNVKNAIISLWEVMENRKNILYNCIHHELCVISVL